MQVAYVPGLPGRSSLHSNVAPASLLNANEDEGPVVTAPSVVSGAVVSTVNVRVAGVGSILPSASLARTENVYSPSVRPV